MKLEEFIKQFSHNNEIYIENKDRITMSYKYGNSLEESLKDIIMDWELEFTDISDCEVIRISNVLRPKQEQGITIVIDTDDTTFAFIKEKITRDKVPLWLYNEIHGTNIIGCESSI